MTDDGDHDLEAAPFDPDDPSTWSTRYRDGSHQLEVRALLTRVVELLEEEHRQTRQTRDYWFTMAVAGFLAGALFLLRSAVGCGS